MTFRIDYLPEGSQTWQEPQEFESLEALRSALASLMVDPNVHTIRRYRWANGAWKIRWWLCVHLYRQKYQKLEQAGQLRAYIMNSL